MGRLFLPGLVVSAENQGTFSDRHVVWLADNLFLRWMYFGGPALDTPSTAQGIFSDYMRDMDGDETDIGFSSRLSKN